MSRRMTKAILLLLMIQNNVFALKCTFGVVFGDPYNQEGTKRGNLIPSSSECQNPEDKCLRIEVDEITDPDSQLGEYCCSFKLLKVVLLSF